MPPEKEASILKKKNKVHVSKSLNVGKGWYVLGPIAAEHIAGTDYRPIPYYLDSYAYQIGHIFVQSGSETQCFCAAAQLKVIGPIRDFLVPSKSNPRWLTPDLPVIKTTGDNVNFEVVLGTDKQTLTFAAEDCYFLNLAPDMKIEREVVIDRSTHEDLSSAYWFGLITAVVITSCSSITMKRNRAERKMYIGEKPHTILFKHIICRMNRAGGIYETSSSGMECKWLPVTERDMDSLPPTKFVSQSNKIKS